MNKTLIIYCHPYKGSFNHSILKEVEASLHNSNQAYDLIDLYNENFNPIYDQEELRLFHDGKTHDALVTKYLKSLQSCDKVIFITPIWWNSISGMLKGFIDKVMKEGEGLSHTVDKWGIHGELKNIKKGYVLTTSTSPTHYFKLLMGNSIKKIFIKKTLKQIGIKKGIWMNFGGITNSKNNRRKKYLAYLRNYKF